jgi:hypothetical protein
MCPPPIAAELCVQFLVLPGAPAAGACVMLYREGSSSIGSFRRETWS